MSANWTAPVGWGALLAVVILIVSVILAVLHMLDLPAALLIAAVCANRL